MMKNLTTFTKTTLIVSALSMGSTPSLAKPIPGLDVSPRLGADTNSNPARATIRSRCRVTIRDASGERSVYATDCLMDHFSQFNALPASCESVLQTQSGNLAFFDPECLRNDGWRTR